MKETIDSHFNERKWKKLISIYFVSEMALQLMVRLSSRNSCIHSFKNIWAERIRVIDRFSSSPSNLWTTIFHARTFHNYRHHSLNQPLAAWKPIIDITIQIANLHILGTVEVLKHSCWEHFGKGAEVSDHCFSVNCKNNYAIGQVIELIKLWRGNQILIEV